MKLCIVGAYGRMGQEILRLAALDASFDRLIGVVRSLKEDEGLLSAANLTYMDSLQDGVLGADVVVNFALPNAFNQLLDSLESVSRALVTGTTGLSRDQLQRGKAMGEKMPILQSFNMSYGVNLMVNLLQAASEKLKQVDDVVVYDRHHRHKKDKPSGTSIMLGSAIDGLKSASEIQYVSERLGTVFGEHKVSFAFGEELIELSHTALSRRVFAQGALKAAKWIQDKKPGFYSMQDLFS